VQERLNSISVKNVDWLHPAMLELDVGIDGFGNLDSNVDG
jgi:hypothetical protein